MVDQLINKMEVKIIRSQRRRRTVSARLVKDVLLVNAPLMISQQRLAEIIDGFKLKFARKKIKSELDKSHSLADLARELNIKYFDNKLKIESIEYVTTQNSRFGCCNYRTAKIRISHKVGLLPKWVKNYVLIHEMAHLIQPNHSRAFWEIVGRYRLTERARGYLMAAGQFDSLN
ncbi:MAG TPA: M48 family metallopeptidase [Candidatus Omnitrophota bacterium]|nr:M48 family metallopeptidase [Candidatus Omnitrophota bacterium]HPT39369.1 M48 family metallopeptidase [Candidatus Omnitrophota bacterium]